MDDMDPLPLPETFDRKAIAEVARMLMDCRGDDTVLDASAVTRMGALAVELLIATRKQWQMDGRSLTIRNGSHAFLSTVHDIGASLDLLQTEAPA